MQVRFAGSRPTGEYALVLPVAGKDRSSLNSLGAVQGAVMTALDRQRFEGEAGGLSEQFVDVDGTVRRIVIVGTGTGASNHETAEKLGGSAVARLLASGETSAVIDIGAL